MFKMSFLNMVIKEENTMKNIKRFIHKIKSFFEALGGGDPLLGVIVLFELIFLFTVFTVALIQLIF